MSASKANVKKDAIVSAPTLEYNHLRVLSNIQRKKVAIIAKDWRRFTIGVFTEMFDKI
jgi:hypothetical protein